MRRSFVGRQAWAWIMERRIQRDLRLAAPAPQEHKSLFRGDPHNPHGKGTTAAKGNGFPPAPK